MDINQSNLNHVLDEIKVKSEHIPLGQSVFQTKNFILGQYPTKGRLLRQLCLEANSKIEVIKSMTARLEKSKIDLEEMKDSLDPKNSNYDHCPYNRRRTKIDIKVLEDSFYLSEKLLKDAFIELNYIWKILSTIPPMTREQFEQEEEEYYTHHLTKQIKGIEGAYESLYNMGKLIDGNGNIVDQLDENKTLIHSKNFSLEELP